MDLQEFNCVLRNAAVEESMSHLFLECPFAIQCWALIDIPASKHSDHFQSLQNFKDQLRVPFFHGDHHTDVLDYLEGKE